MSKCKNLTEQVVEVSVESLPLSLRHSGRGHALDDAKYIASFLRDITLLEDTTSLELEKDGIQGLGLVLGLLLDKINIASGEYQFPFLSWGENAPVLAERKWEEQA